MFQTTNDYKLLKDIETMQINTINGAEYMTTSEACKYLGIKIPTLRQYLVRNYLRYIKIDRLYFVNYDDLKARKQRLEDQEKKKQRAKKRLEEIRKELEAEAISYGELVELQELADYIEDGDVQLLEAAGVKEGSRN